MRRVLFPLGIFLGALLAFVRNKTLWCRKFLTRGLFL
jgi:hypothetical protein